MNKRIALIIGFYPLGTSSVLINLIEMLVRNNFYVDIYIDSFSMIIPFSHPSDKVNILIESRPFYIKLLNRLYYYFLKLFQKNNILIKIKNASINYFHFSIWTNNIIKRKPTYNIILFANFSSIYVSSSIKKQPETSIYYNLEILDNEMAGETHWNEIREIERIHLKYMDWVFATSQKRGECFQKLTDFPSDRIRILPVLSISGDKPQPSDYFYKKFNISKIKKIIIITGSISKRLLQLEIINTVKYWPKDIVLVIHTWREGTFNNGYGLLLKEAANGLPVFFSTESLDYNDIISAIASAYIGLAFYDDFDTNMKEILLSSNKIIEYLRCGIPVITSYNFDLYTFFKNNKCGLSVNPNDIPNAINTISNDYMTYKNASIITSNNNFSFEKYFYNAFNGINNINFN